MVIHFEPDAPLSPSLYYYYDILNQANPEGYSNNSDDFKGVPILISYQSEIYLVNDCQSECIYEIHKTSNTWNTDGKIEVYINRIKKGDFNGETTPYSVNKGDTIKYVTVGMGVSSLGDSLETVNVQEPSIAIYKWYALAYFTPALVPNQCTKSIPPAPFGGKLTPATQEEINEFLTVNSASLSSIWYPKCDELCVSSQ